MIVLVLGIAQVPALIVTLPAIGYIWWTGDYGTVEAVVYTALIFVSGMADNVLKPLMLGRGVDAPMPIILIGALGGNGRRRDSRDVRRCHAAGVGLPDIHGLGGRPRSGGGARPGARQTGVIQKVDAPAPQGRPHCDYFFTVSTTIASACV